MKSSDSLANKLKLQKLIGMLGIFGGQSSFAPGKRVGRYDSGFYTPNKNNPTGAARAKRLAKKNNNIRKHGKK